MNEITIKSQEGIVNYASEYVKRNNMILSKGYNLPVAMNNMWLSLLASNEKNKCLEKCSELSIRTAIENCINKELDTGKTQGYFIPYGNELQFQPSYFGEIKRARDVANVIINSWVIHDGEPVDIESRVDGSLIVHHKPDFKCFDKDIIGAYAIASDVDTGRVVNSDIMTATEINKSLAKSPTGGKVAKEFKNQMFQRTVSKRLAKRIVNTSDDHIKLSITDVDGRVINIDDSARVYDYDDYTINTDEQIAKESAKFEPKEENIVTSDDLSITPITPDEVEIPEGAIRVDYKKIKENRNGYKVINGTYDQATYTVMAIPLSPEE